MSEDPNKTQTEREFADFAKDTAKLIGKFLFDLGRLTVRGLFKAYRAIGRRRVQEARDGDRAVRNADNTIGNMMDTVRKATGNNKTDQPENSDAAPHSSKLVEKTSESDVEAMSLLDDLLQETARDLRQKGIDPAALPPDELLATPPQKQAPPANPTDIDNATPADTSADIPPTAEPPQDQPITYDTPDEKARIAAQLHERESLLAQEVQERKAIYDEKAAHQEELRAAVQADRERRLAEQRAREEAFQKAEAERKAREEARRQAALSRTRLVDTDPKDETTGTETKPDTRHQTNQD